MDLNDIMKTYADKIGGQYRHFENQETAIIIPLSEDRFQTVVGSIRYHLLYRHNILYLSSKIGLAQPDMDYRKLLEQMAGFSYCRFYIQNNYLQIELVATFHDALTKETVEKMIDEISNLADEYEMKLTGRDVQ